LHTAHEYRTPIYVEDGMLQEEVACSAIPQCNIPPPGEGCCVLGDNNCLNDQTEADCTAVGGIDFEVDTACSAVPQCDIHHQVKAVAYWV
ncbi:MAG: hypothetical protein KAJ31_06940, partial [Deltaproteobacteria bacterium]|nr:hypothetical protein [Deltaproteobacteria bacterium]